jgi:hypothetical protein
VEGIVVDGADGVGTVVDGAVVVGIVVVGIVVYGADVGGVEVDGGVDVAGLDSGGVAGVPLVGQASIPGSVPPIRPGPCGDAGAHPAGTAPWVTCRGPP